MFAVGAERHRYLIVPKGAHFAAASPVRAEFPQLDPVLGVPFCIIADNRNERQFVCHGGVHLCHVEAERPITHDGNDGCLPLRETSPQSEREPGTDGATHAVDQAVRRVQAGLGPLPDLSAIGNEHGFRVAVEQCLQRPQELHGVQVARAWSFW